MKKAYSHLLPLRTILSAAVIGMAGLALASAAQAQSVWPGKPVRIMVGASAGGGTDVIARMLADRFADTWKQSFVVENRPGASNTIAADLTAKAAPDGHTLLVATNTGQAIAPHMLKLSYDPLKDLQPVGMIVEVPNVVLVSATLPIKTAAELIADMKAKPQGYRYGSSGVGSTQHLAGEAFDLATGVKSIHVPYKGSSQAHVDVISGAVQLMFDTTSSSMPQIRAGKMRPLAVMSPRRSAQLPEVPTLAEAGVPSLEMSTWYGLFVTGGTPAPVVALLHNELRRVLTLPEVSQKLAGLGGEQRDMTIEAFAAFNRAEFQRFGKLIAEA
ncbi:MAG: tripartite tricarboxylate transporter substrate binding protein, partial [Betaproteobacteria bacterium]|nr:tripartite tricarboxylate transporter substrate binding protein [Betaproteobacteria bacterium]